MIRWWYRLKRLCRWCRGVCAIEPKQWRKAGNLFVRRFQPQLKQLAQWLSQSRKEDMVLIFDPTQRAALLMVDDECLARIRMVQLQNEEAVMQVIVQSNLIGEKAYFQLAFIGLSLDWQPFKETLRLNEKLPRGQ